jgi:hypothetical protein
MDVMKKSKKRYVGEETKLFINFLPEEIFLSFSDEEKKNYREYRRYQRFIGESNSRIQKYQIEVEKLLSKINFEKVKIKGGGDEDGWEKSVEFFYNQISHLDKDLKLNCSIEKRNRTSKSKKVEDGVKRVISSERTNNTYKGERLNTNFKFYGRVETLSNRKSFYFGDEVDMRRGLEEIFNENWSKDDFDSVKDELKSLMSQFSRYHIFKTNWEEFKVGTYNIKTLVDWCKWCEESGVDRYEWGGYR